MAFCEQCGNKISDTAKFCGKCGTPFSSEQDENISAPAACAQCGAPLEEGEMFCPNCGAKVGAVSAVPAQTQGQAGSGGVLKAGTYVANIVGEEEVGKLLLYRDRLEYHGKNSLVCRIYDIQSVEREASGIRLTIYEKDINSRWIFWVGIDAWEKYIKHPGLSSKSSPNIEGIDSEMDSWVDAINSVRNGTLV